MTDNRACCKVALPYDMGNAGDLLKHGVLAEFVRWRCESSGAAKPFRFLDPFGGLPFCGSGGSWCDGENPAIERFSCLAKAAPDCALVKAQPDIPDRYYGSGHLACRAARAAGAKIIVHASDGVSSSRKRLVESGLLPLDFPGFKPECAYSVLESELPPDGEILLLLDPFGDFLECGIYQRVIPKIAKLPPHAATMLFVLRKWKNEGKYDERRNEYLKGAWVMSCPPLPRDGRFRKILGERSRHVELLLIAPHLLSSADAEGLRRRLNDFAEKLAGVLPLPCEILKPMLKPQVIGRDG